MWPGGRSRRAPAAARLGPLRVIPVLAGLTAAVMWGLSTVVASRSTKVLGSQGALAWVMLIGGALTLALAPISGIPHGISNTAWGWAITAGFGSAFGLSMMYRALRIGKVGVVAPIASTEGALAAVLSIALGERLTAGDRHLSERDRARDLRRHAARLRDRHPPASVALRDGGGLQLRDRACGELEGRPRARGDLDDPRRPHHRRERDRAARSSCAARCPGPAGCGGWSPSRRSPS